MVKVVIKQVQRKKGYGGGGGGGVVTSPALTPFYSSLGQIFKDDMNGFSSFSDNCFIVVIFPHSPASYFKGGFRSECN
jgi:hypothetical protein